MNTRGRDFGTPRRSSWRWGNVHVMEEWSERSQPEYLQRLRKVPTEEMRQFWNFLAVTAKHMILYYLQLTQPLFLPFKLSSEKAMNGTPLQYSCLENPMDGGASRLQSMGSRRVGLDWATSLSLFTFMHWRRKWQPTPVFLTGESQGQRSLVGCLWGRTESDTTEAT